MWPRMNFSMLTKYFACSIAFISLLLAARGYFEPATEKMKISREELDLWIELGLVSDEDIAFNHQLGLVDEDGMPI